MYDAFTSEARALRRDMSACASQVNKINRIPEVVHERGQEWAQAEVHPCPPPPIVHGLSLARLTCGAPCMQIDDRKKEKDKLTKELNEVRTLL